MALIEPLKKKNPWQCFIGAYKKYAEFEGRASKAEFWWFHFFFFIISVIFIVSIIALALFFSIDESSNLSDYPIYNTLLAILLIWWLISLVPLFTVAVRRMHDCNKHGAFLLIPIYGWFVLPLTKGSSGTNRYDPNPGEAAQGQAELSAKAVAETEDIVSKESGSSPGICKRCGEPVTGNFCQNCGSPVRMETIDKHYFVKEIKGVLGVQSGFFYSLKRLLVFPGISAKQYIKDNRNNFVKPVIYLFFTSLLYTLIYNIVGEKHASQYDTEIITKFDQIYDFLINWLNSNVGYAFLIISFISAFTIKRVFKKYKYNIYEILVLMCFLNGTLLTISYVFEIIGYFLPFSIYEMLEIIFIGFIPVYYVWGVASFFDPRKVKNYAKAFLGFLIPWVYVICITIIVFLVYDYAI